jgi:hypothetical protein
VMPSARRMPPLFKLLIPRSLAAGSPLFPSPACGRGKGEGDNNGKSFHTPRSWRGVIDSPKCLRIKEPPGCDSGVVQAANDPTRKSLASDPLTKVFVGCLPDTFLELRGLSLPLVSGIVKPYPEGFQLKSIIVSIIHQPEVGLLLRPRDG